MRSFGMGILASCVPWRCSENISRSSEDRPGCAETGNCLPFGSHRQCPKTCTLLPIHHCETASLHPLASPCMAFMLGCDVPAEVAPSVPPPREPLDIKAESSSA